MIPGLRVQPAFSAAEPLLLVLLLLPGGCATGPRPVDGAIDPRVYSICQDPEGATAWQRAQQAMVRSDDDAALVDLRLCTQRCPDLVRAHLAYQDIARRKGGEVQQAMQDFYMQAPERDSPVPAYLKARLAETDYARRNALDAILVRDPSFAWAHLSRARVNRRQGRLLQAVDMFADAIVHDGALHEARLERAQVLAELGREEEAAVDYRAYLREVPGDLAATRAFVTLLLYRLGRVDEALPLLDRLEKEMPGSLSLRMDRAAASWRRPKESIEAYLGILAVDPKMARALWNIGMLYYEVLPKNEADRRRYWPKARAAFRLFLDVVEPGDGHEHFERTLAVPYKLEVIAELLGPASGQAVSVDDLKWPGDG
ncbi:MAG TPA: tetratricopeptide repeat protein [Planctomycetota bacterium]